jgi:hypothetical protein
VTMHKLYTVPEERIEEEVSRELTIPLIEVREDEFEAYIKERDLADFNERDKKILLAMSVVEQKQNWLIYAIQIANRQMRHLQAETIRQRKVNEKQELQQKLDGWKWGLIKWIGMTLGAGVLASLAKKWF